MSETKSEIIETRSIGFGSSDAKMIVSVGKNKKLNKTAENRIAILLGQKEKKGFSTLSTKYGDFIEECIYEYLRTNKRFSKCVFESNPFYEITDIKYRFKIFNHIDIEAKGHSNVVWFEVKATNDDLQKTFKKYKEQLAWHYWILKNKYKSVYKESSIKLFLVHYHTKDKISDFDPSRISILEYKEDGITIKNIENGLFFIDSIIDSFQYTESQNLNVTILPSELQKQLDDIYLFKKQEAEMKVKIKNFTSKMYSLMAEKGVDSIKTKTISITKINPTEAKSVDLEFLQKNYPKIYDKCLTSKKKNGYVLLKTI